MKREELTPIDLECNMGKDSVTGLVNREPCKAYDIDEVNQVLDEKDAEIDDLLRQNRELCQALQVMYSKEEYGKLQKEIESLKASHYAEMVDAGMRERRLRRALWLAHAYKAKFKRWWLHLALDCEASAIHTDTKTLNRIRGKIRNCEKSERKCRAKAEEYR